MEKTIDFCSSNVSGCYAFSKIVFTITFFEFASNSLWVIVTNMSTVTRFPKKSVDLKLSTLSDD